MSLTIKKVQAASVPHGKNQVKLTDGNGLYLLVRQSGKYWRYDYTFSGKRKTYHIGSFPDISLAGHKLKDGTYIKGARDFLIEAKLLVKKGVDPSLHKQQKRELAMREAEKAKQLQEEESNTFQAVAIIWFEKKKQTLSPKYHPKILSRLTTYIFPKIGDVPVNKLKGQQIFQTIEAIQSSGKIETAKRCNQLVRSIMEFACNAGLISNLPFWKVDFNERPVKHMPTITDTEQIRSLLIAIDGYSGTTTVRCALQLLPYLAVRPGEFRQARWQDFDFSKRIWSIPPAHRKLKTAQKHNVNNIHLVPLSRQAEAILIRLKHITGDSTYVFPNAFHPTGVMSENTINQALKRIGFQGKIVGHGFRAMFSTSLNTMGYNPDAIERQLAHTERNAVRAAYNRSDYLNERIQMMQDWANFLDDIKKGGEECTR